MREILATWPQTGALMKRATRRRRAAGFLPSHHTGAMGIDTFTCISWPPRRYGHQIARPRRILHATPQRQLARVDHLQPLPAPTPRPAPPPSCRTSRHAPTISPSYHDARPHRAGVKGIDDYSVAPRCFHSRHDDAHFMLLFCAEHHFPARLRRK